MLRIEIIWETIGRQMEIDLNTIRLLYEIKIMRISWIHLLIKIE